MSPKEIYLIRHGQTDWNKEGRFQGHLDVPLNELGRKQAEALIKPLGLINIQAVLSSDLKRAQETAAIIAQALGIPLTHTKDLREAHLGQAQGLTVNEMKSQFGEKLVSGWGSHDPTDADVKYPGGETGTAVLERVFGALENFALSQPFERIGVATHGGVIRRMVHALLPKHTERVPIPNGILYLLHFHLKSRKWEFQNWVKIRKP